MIIILTLNNNIDYGSFGKNFHFHQFIRLKKKEIVISITIQIICVYKSHGARYTNQSRLFCGQVTDRYFRSQCASSKGT